MSQALVERLEKVSTMSKPCQVGGQAVLEGVMMRSPRSLAVAVRRPSKEIVVKEAVWRSLWDRLRFLRWPFLRGTIVMLEAMLNGMQAMSFSAKEAMPEEEGASAGAEPSRVSVVLPLLLSVVLAIGLFKVLPHMAATYAGKVLLGAPLTVNDVLYHLVDGLVKVLIFVAYIVGISFFKDIKRVFMYHGAEHMSIYTHERGEELIVANARLKSTLHPRCGTAFIMVVILTFIVVAALLMPYMPEWAKPGEGKPWFNHLLVVLFKLPLLIPVAGLSYEFNRFVGRRADNPFFKFLLLPGLGMQLLTTRRPTDDQLEVALVALRTALWRERVGESVPDDDELLVFDGFEAFEAASGELRAARSES
jgi:uncharacterized protein YqhQ